MNNNIEAALDRMAALQKDISLMGDDTEEFIWEEYRNLLAPTVATLLPLIQKMAQAGLFTLHLREDALQEARDWSKDVGRLQTVDFEVRDVFNNGNIWIQGGHIAGASGDKQNPRDKN